MITTLGAVLGMLLAASLVLAGPLLVLHERFPPPPGRRPVRDRPAAPARAAHTVVNALGLPQGSPAADPLDALVADAAVAPFPHRPEAVPVRRPAVVA